MKFKLPSLGLSTPLSKQSSYFTDYTADLTDQEFDSVIRDDVSDLTESDFGSESQSETSSEDAFIREELEREEIKQDIEDNMKAMLDNLAFSQKGNAKQNAFVNLQSYLEKIATEKKLGATHKKSLKTLLADTGQKENNDKQLTALHRRFKWRHYAQLLENPILRMCVLAQIEEGIPVKSQITRSNTEKALKAINDAIKNKNKSIEEYQALLKSVNISLSHSKIKEMLGITENYTDIEDEKIKSLFKDMNVPLNHEISEGIYNAFNAFQCSHSGWMSTKNPTQDKKTLAQLLIKIVETGFDSSKLLEKIYDLKCQEHCCHKLENPLLKQFIQDNHIVLEVIDEDPHTFMGKLALDENIAAVNDAFSKPIKPDDMTKKYIKLLENVGIFLTPHQKRHDLPRILSAEKERTRQIQVQPVHCTTEVTSFHVGHGSQRIPKVIEKDILWSPTSRESLVDRHEPAVVSKNAMSKKTPPGSPKNVADLMRTLSDSFDSDDTKESEGRDIFGH